MKVPRCYRRLLPLPVVVLMAGLPSPGIASERLYSVELIVFAREAAGMEAGPADVVLNYPDAARRLAAAGTTQAADTAADSNATDDTSADNTPTEQPNAGDVTTTPPLFQSMGSDELRLTDAARIIDRQPDLRVLLHERWVQPAQVDGRSAPVAVGGGERFGEHHELEGYVTLLVQRFLHFHTDLWLSRFDRMPAADATFGGDEPAASQATSQVTGIHLPPPPDPYQPSAAAEQVSTSSLLADENDEREQRDTEPFEEAPADASSSVVSDPRPEYSAAEITVLRQQRRTRFGELHYLDHPRLGALVQVTPVEPENSAETTENVDRGNGDKR